MELHAKLLMAIEERKVEKVGGKAGAGEHPYHCIYQNRPWQTCRGKENSCQTFIFACMVFPIHLPPLRERKRHIKMLINYFANGRKVEFDIGAFNSLLKYNWHGNIRKLKNIIERFVLLAQNGKIDITKVPQETCNPVTIPITQLVGHKPWVDILSEVEMSTLKIA